MAKTYTVGKALALLQTQMCLPDITPFAAPICDEALSFIWDAFDWKASLGELAPFYLLPQEQDYGAPLSAVPSDLMVLRTARVRNNDSYTVKDLDVVASLPVTDLFAFPDTISYEPAVSKFRVHPVPPGSLVASQYQVEGTYKKNHTQVTPATINSLVLPWDDQYFDVFRKTLRWKWLDETGSSMAGQIVFYPDGSVSATGSAAVAWHAILNMARREGLGDAPEQIVPNVELFR